MMSERAKPKIIDDETLERMRGIVSEEPHTLTHAHSRSGALVAPEDQGTIKGVAVTAMHQQTAKQMDQLAEQIHLLARQYEQLKRRMEMSERIYLATIPFTPRIGQLYHLYAKDHKEDILSMLAPGDWGIKGSPYQNFLASVRLLADHTWELVEGNV
jgi:hypothetical protein